MKSNFLRIFLIAIGLNLNSCNEETIAQDQHNDDSQPPIEGAIVKEVITRGQENAYSFSVTLESPDTGCDQYADWWEIVSESGELLYRRTLGHSHINEQPFTRSGGPVAISSEQVVWVRAHMNNTGYGGLALKGTVKEGFERAIPPRGFAKELNSADPLPPPCAF